MPNEGQPPFLAAIIKPTSPSYEIILLNKELGITGISQKCADIFEVNNSKNLEQKITSVIPKFDEISDGLKKEHGVLYKHTREATEFTLNLKLRELKIGRYSAYVLKVENMTQPEEPRPLLDLPAGELDPQTEGKTVSSVI